MVSSTRLAELLDIVLARRAPPRIPRSGEAAKSVNCFSASFSFEGSEYLLDARTGDQVSCRRWTGNQTGFAEPTSLSLYDIWSATPDIRHFLGHYELKWTSWRDFSFDQRTRYIYLKLWWTKAASKANQFYLSRRTLTTVERYSALRALWDLQLQSDSNEVGLTSILMKVHGRNYYLHPNHERATKLIGAIFSALRDTGEVKSTSGGAYSITGKGLSMLEVSESEERKHQDAMRTHRRIFWLTVFLVLSAIIQAGMVEVPPMLKIEKWPWQAR